MDEATQNLLRQFPPGDLRNAVEVIDHYAHMNIVHMQDPEIAEVLSYFAVSVIAILQDLSDGGTVQECKDKINDAARQAISNAVARACATAILDQDGPVQ